MQPAQHVVRCIVSVRLKFCLGVMFEYGIQFDEMISKRQSMVFIKAGKMTIA